MPTTKELIDQRATVWESMKANMAITDRTAELDAEYDRLDGEVERLSTSIERSERHAARESEFTKVDRSGVVPPQGGAPEGENVPADEQYARAFGQFIRYGASDMDPADRRALQANAVSGSEFRALGVTGSFNGGYVVPEQFRNRMVEAIKAFGGMLDVAEVINTDSGATINWPTSDETAAVGAILAENTQVGEQDLTLGTADIDAYMYTSKLVRVSYQLLQDSVFDIDAWLPRKLGERIGRILNQHWTTGTGVGQPDGVVTNAVAGVTAPTGQVDSVTYVDLVDLIDSIEESYQTNARFMMNRTTRKAFRKLIDGNDRPLWEPSLQVGVPDSILGYPIKLNQDMPSLGAGAKAILFGDFREAYLIRLVTGVQTLRLSERYADYLQVGFLAFQRADGTMQNSAAIRAFQTAAA
jgi:HK97 family phage major capsid protein